MMKNIFVCIFIVLFPQASFAYTESTHEDMASHSLERSIVVSDNTFLLSKLGLLNSSIDDDTQEIPDSNGGLSTIRELIRWGARFEDDKEAQRSLNHFYDPAYDRPLTVLGATWGETSPDWALEGAHDIGSQSYSYKDATNYLYNALTLQNETDRKRNFGLMFQTLGHVVHHLQDMAQPQHVRNDAHCDQIWPCALAGQNVYDLSHFEAYTQGNLSRIAGLMSGSSYPVPRFSTAREFWTTSGHEGLADFTNRNFISKDSNFTLDNTNHIATVEYALPYPNESTLADTTPVSLGGSDGDGSLMGVAGTTLCNKLKQNSSVIFPSGGCFIHFVSTTVTDAKLGTSGVNARASSHSIFNQYLTNYHEPIIIDTDDGGSYEARGFFTLNQYNFEAAYNFLIPRAVAFSAGLINHFFRGKMAISLPEQSIYGIVDQSTVQGINATTGFRGFNKIKFKVANTTPPLPGHSAPESMNNGMLEAVIKFHRNTCWQDDLSQNPPAAGVFVEDATTGEYSCRSNEEEIVVSSNKYTISAANPLTSTPQQEFIFNFPNELPINATDVYLQAVYKGRLGNETDVVVVTTKDISEPTFTMVANFTDYYTSNGNFNLVPPWNPPDPYPYSEPDVTSVAYLINESANVNPVSVAFLNKPVGSYGSVAFLTDIGTSLPLTNDVELLMLPGNMTKNAWCNMDGVTIVGWQEQFTATTSSTSAFSKVRSSYTQQPHVCTNDGGDNSQPSIDKYTQMEEGSTISPVDITGW